MSDVGDYWREHKEYKRNKELGLTKADLRQMERGRIAQKKQEHHDRCTVKCECGKWFLDTPAHNCHKNHKGKAGHKAIETKERKEPEYVDWTDVL